MTDKIKIDIFWSIEKRDLVALETICKTLQQEGQDIGMYFPFQSWDQVFEKNEAKQIKVYLCGSIDFSPLQHAFALDWLAGCKCLIAHNVGCTIQGQGLKVLNNEWINAIKNIPLN